MRRLAAASLLTAALTLLWPVLILARATLGGPAVLLWLGPTMRAVAALGALGDGVAIVALLVIVAEMLHA